MSMTGLEVFDSSLQRTNIWLDELIAELGPDRRHAWHVLGAVLHAIRDRLPTELVAHFGAQLPLVVRGLHYDQWSPGAETKKGRTLGDFLQQIEESMKGGRPTGSSDAAAAVFRVLSRHLNEGQIGKVQASLSESIREAWFAAERQNMITE